MQCHNCNVENKPDTLYCRRCGKFIRKCLICAITHEEDALYCRRCGKPLNRRPEEFTKLPTREVSGGAAAHSRDFDRDVDFTTKVSPKQVERIPKGRSLNRGSRAALCIIVVLMLVTALIAVVAVWRSAQTLRPELARQSEELKADFEEFKKIVAETKQADRRAILEDIGVALAKAREEERKATNEEIRKVVARARAEDRKSFNEEIAKAVAKAREEDRGIIIAELTKLKVRTKNREFNRHIERVIAMFRVGGKPGTNKRQENAGGERRREANRRRGEVPAE